MENVTNTIDIARVKQYNSELKMYTEKSASLRAKLEMSANEVNRLCAELTQELGIQVTPENLESVYKQCVDKIENTLAAGEEILRRVKNEEQAIPTQGLEATVPADGFATVTGQVQSGLDGVGQLPNMFGNI